SAEEILAQLRAVLCDDSANLALRFRALFSLKHLATNGDIGAVEAIASAFSSDSALLKHELAYCLGQSSNSHAAPYLQSVLSNLSEDPMVRHEAGEALGALGHEESLPLLREFLTREGEFEEVRQTCEVAISRLEWLGTEEGKAAKVRGEDKSGFTSIDPAPPTSEEEREELEEIIQRMELRISILQETLTDQSLPLFSRYRAMFRLRNLVNSHPSLAIPALASGFDDPSALFRHEIAFVFGQLGHPDSVPYLIPVARNKKEHAMVRHEAVEALGSVGGDVEGVEEYLKEMAASGERVVRESAIVALDMVEFERSGELEYALIPG
ncbi:ARM repeat-containing protein, partial [Terfezia boudieri ATCC MYA-4762]